MIYGVIKMLKEHINDLFTEGLGDIFFMKYYNFINKNVKDETLKCLLIGIHVIVYLAFLLGIVYLIFSISFPI